MNAQLRLVCILALALLGIGCDRQFADQSEPSIQIISPDESEIFIDPNVEVRIKSSSDTPLTRVDAGNVSMVYDSFTDTWFANVVIGRGINRIVIRSFSEIDPPESDTLFLFRLPFEVSDAGSQIKLGLAGHTVTPTPGGGVIAIGGVRSQSGPAEDDAFILPSVFSNQFSTVSSTLNTARTGHSATLISERRIVLMGGARSNAVQSIDELVEQPEIFMIDDGLFVPLHVDGDPIRRMNHTAIFRNTVAGPVIDLVGGTGDIQYVPEPLLGTRDDIRSFLLRNDSLIALSPAVGPSIERVSGHTQVELTASPFGIAGVFLLTGESAGPPVGPINLFVNFASQLGILVDPAPESRIPRRDHAGVRIGFELIGLFGGTRISNGEVLSIAELYDNESRRSFVFPQGEGQQLIGRHNHTATIVGSNLIMITGGFDSNGDIVDTVEFFSYQF